METQEASPPPVENVAPETSEAMQVKVGETAAGAATQPEGSALTSLNTGNVLPPTIPPLSPKQRDRPSTSGGSETPPAKRAKSAGGEQVLFRPALDPRYNDYQQCVTKRPWLWARQTLPFRPFERRWRQLSGTSQRLARPQRQSVFTLAPCPPPIRERADDGLGPC